jgi:ribosomal protein S12 methylthiotransferase
LPDKVPAKAAGARARRVLSIQRKISKLKNRAMIGKTIEVLVEGPSEESELVMVGRHPGQAPEIDGSVYLSGGPVQPGELRRAVVTQASDYDLVADVIDEPPLASRNGESSPLVHRSSDGRRIALRTVA